MSIFNQKQSDIQKKKEYEYLKNLEDEFRIQQDREELKRQRQTLIIPTIPTNKIINHNRYIDNYNRIGEVNNICYTNPGVTETTNNQSSFSKSPFHN